ncbi:hypothetical protein Q1695_002416 [Nippostrongylus brasiliensis]|nr:hypothetical protein Q1695_002416 [Nippostrongylus brasiliensis]
MKSGMEPGAVDMKRERMRNCKPLSMLRPCLLVIVFVATAQAAVRTVDWCSYFRERSIYRPECKYSGISDGIRRHPSKKSHVVVCSVEYHYCTKSDACGDGNVRCLDLNYLRECCAPNICPAVEKLSSRCVSSVPDNLCKTDADCRHTALTKCCPTACNYNICL